MLYTTMRNWILPPHLQYLWRIARGNEPRAHIMRFAREVVAWAVPTEVQSFLLSRMHDIRGVDVSRTAKLANRHQGEGRCFVIGSGPSLKGMDLSPLVHEYTIAHNSFYKHPDAEQIGLNYLCIADESFFEDHERSVAWHQIIESKLPDVELMFHGAAKSLIRKHGLYANHSIYYYRHGVTVHYPELVHFDFTKPRNVGHTVGSTVGIPLAVYLGFKNIYLIGFDANWLDDYGGSYHFYDAHDQWPEFDSLQTDYRQPRYQDQLIFAQREYHSHYLLAEATAKLGVQIYNATGAGHLDMYPRVNYKELF